MVMMMIKWFHHHSQNFPAFRPAFTSPVRSLRLFAKMRLCATLLLALQPSLALRLPHGDRPSRRVALRTILALPFVPLPSFGGSCVCVTLTDCVCEGPAATEGGGACI